MIVPRACTFLVAAPDAPTSTSLPYSSACVNASVTNLNPCNQIADHESMRAGKGSFHKLLSFAAA